jgi:uncharacterized cupin superfamily protein
MHRTNIADPSFVYDPADPEGFRAGMARFGRDIGAEQTGTSVYELPPGQAVCPYHYEYGEEEWALVLEGRPSARGPEASSSSSRSTSSSSPRARPAPTRSATTRTRRRAS